MENKDKNSENILEKLDHINRITKHLNFFIDFLF